MLQLTSTAVTLISGTHRIVQITKPKNMSVAAIGACTERFLLISLLFIDLLIQAGPLMTK
jgi:hypothetical protein